MKTRIILIPVLLVFLLLQAGCSSALDNSISISSIAERNVYLNILGKLITIKPNETKTIRQISKGSYAYTTTFEIPSGVASSTMEGNGTGSLTMGPGTKVNFFYASKITTMSGSGSAGQSSYVLIASVSSSDKLSSTSTTSP